MLKLLSILTAGLIALAFTLRWTIPDKFRSPGGWPLGTHWYRTNVAAFWLFLTAGIIVGLVLLFKVAVRGRTGP